MRRYDTYASERAVSTAAYSGIPKNRSQGARYDWKAGDKVTHKLWGKGKVLSVSGTGKSMILKLQFPGRQHSQVMAAFAPLEKED